jgi:hypothetical protein
MGEQRGVQSLLRHLCNLTKLLCETDYVQAFSRARAVVILFSFFFYYGRSLFKCVLNVFNLSLENARSEHFVNIGADHTNLPCEMHCRSHSVFQWMLCCQKVWSVGFLLLQNFRVTDSLIAVDHSECRSVFNIDQSCF